MKKIDKLRKEEQKQLEVLELIRTEIKLLKSKTKVECTNNKHGEGCGKKHEIRKLQYISTHWYTRPTGCSDGDYWTEGEGNFICPKCGHRNRLYDREEIEDLKDLFESIINESD